MNYTFQKKKILVATNIALATTIMFISGCSKELSESERAEVVRLYSEILIAEPLYEKDTATLNHLLDSLFDGTDYKSIDDVQEKIKEIAREDPDGLRLMFDSTQKRLERVRDDKRMNDDTSTSVRDTIKDE